MAIQAILDRPLPIAAAVALLTVAFGLALPSLGVDNTPETWLPSGLVGLERLAEFQRRFGDDSLILAFTTGPAAVGPERGSDWQELLAGLRAVPGVETVLAPVSAELDKGGPRHPLRFYLESEDGRTVALALFPEPGSSPEQRGLLVARLDDFFAPWRDRLGEFHLAGADVITYELDRGSQQSLGGFSPLVFAAMCLVLLIGTREWRVVVVGLLGIVAVVVWSLGLVAVAGRPMNLVLAVMPAILSVVIIAQAMHLVSRFQSVEVVAGQTVDRAVRKGWWSEAMGATWRPCLLCTLTTAAGLASLGVSEIPPVRDLGLFSAMGVLFSFVVCFTFVPAMLATSRAVRPSVVVRRPWWTPERADRFAGWLRRRSIPIALAGLALAVVAAFGLSRLRPESHILTFFPERHRVPTNYRAVEEQLMGLSPLELVVEGGRERMTSDEVLFAYRDLLADSVAEEPLLRQVVSVLLEPTRGAELEFVLEPEELREALEEEGVPEGLKSFLQVDDDRYVLRTTLLASTDSSNAVHALVERLRARLASRLPGDLDAEITGSATLLIQGQVLLLETQLGSFGLALMVVTAVIVVAFRSLGLALLSLLPNLLPILITLGLMGWAGVPLNTATVTVAGIALGLIVDDTIHFLHHWRSRRRGGAAASVAAADTLYFVGRPALITSLAVAVGFGMFALAPFRPTRFFGLLIAVTAMTALLCDFVVLPALLQLRAARTAGSNTGVRSLGI